MVYVYAQVSEMQNSANVLQTYLPACGPSLPQLTDACFC